MTRTVFLALLLVGGMLSVLPAGTLLLFASAQITNQSTRPDEADERNHDKSLIVPQLDDGADVNKMREETVAEYREILERVKIYEEMVRVDTEKMKQKKAARDAAKSATSSRGKNSPPETKSKLPKIIYVPIPGPTPEQYQPNPSHGGLLDKWFNPQCCD